MRVGVKDRVQAPNVFPNRLLAEIGSGVNQDRMPAVLNQDRWSSAVVSRIRGMTDGAVAANRGHAHRRAAAQHG